MDNPRTVRNLTTNTTWIIPQLSESLPQVQHGQSNNYQIAYHKYNMDNPTTVRKLTTNTTWTILQLSESLPQVQHRQSHSCQKAYHIYNMDNPTAVRKLTTYITWTIPQLSESSPALIKPQGTYNIRARVNRFLSHHSVAVTARKEVEDKCDRYAKSTNKCEMPITQS